MCYCDVCEGSWHEQPCLAAVQCVRMEPEMQVASKAAQESSELHRAYGDAGGVEGRFMTGGLQSTPEVNSDDGGDAGRTTTAGWQSAPEVRSASAEAQATPEAASMNLELHEVMGNAGGDEGRITTADLQVAPRGAGRRPPLRGQRQAPEAAVDSRHGIKKGAVKVQIKIICAALLCHSGAPMARG